MTQEPKLISLRDFSLSYNLIFDENFITRNHFLDEIEELATNDNKLILIEGAEGIGKTNLLLQFATRHRFDSLSYFINPACKFTVKQDFLMNDLGKQISFYLNDENDDTVIDHADFNSLIFRLLRSPIKKNKKIYIIIDGLDQIEKSEAELLKPILENLPWSTNNFTFIITGTAESLAGIIPDQVFKKSKTFRVIRFSYEETCKFFSWTDNIYSKEVHQTWNGHPERLGQVKRLLDSGISIEDFLARDDVREKNTLLEIEWSQAKIDSLNFTSELIKLICILAYDDNIRSLKKIIGILTSDTEDFETQIEGISFLLLKGDDISFVSRAYRQFAINKLKKYEKKTFALLISYYTDQDDLSTVLNLPSLYDRNQDWSSIINLLTVNNLDLIISGSQSFADIKKQLNYGYKASRSLTKAYEELFRFSLYRSLVNGLQKSDIRETQIQAYVALGKLEDAISLINKVILREDKLKMMIKFAMECKIRNLTIEPLIVKDIEDLITGIEIEFITENIVDISIGLAHFLPNLAIEVIEKASGLKSHTSSLEWLFTYIGFIISKNRSEDESDNIKVSNSQDSKLNETFIDKFSKSMGYALNGINESEIIERISEIDNITDKLFFAKSWIRKNHNASNILEIINFAINLLLESSSLIKPTTTTLLEILHPLPYLEDHNSISDLTMRIDELLLSINSPTSDKIRLQLLIIEAMVDYDMNRANERIMELYELVHTLTDYSIKIEAYSDCWSLVHKLNKKDKDLAKNFILDEVDVKNEIIKDIDIFLASIANQYEELENTFEILAEIDIDFSLFLVTKLNNSSTKSEAIYKIIEVYTTTKINLWDVTKIKKALELIEIRSYYVLSLISIFEAAEQQIDESINYKDKIVELIPLINSQTSFRIKCRLLSISIRILIKEPSVYVNLIPKYDKLIDNLKGFLKQYWDKIDNPVLRITTGYKLTSAFVDFDRSLSEEFLKSTENIVNEHIIDNKTHVKIFTESIRIMIRLYAGVNIKNKSFSYEKIESLINYVPSNLEKLALWSELSVRVNLSGNSGIAEDIVTKKITPIIDRYKAQADNYYFHEALNISASAIHLSQPEALRLLIEKAPIHIKEKIISSVCFVSITKSHESEPFNDIKGSADFKYQDAIEFINLISFLETDHDIYHKIKNICSISKHYPNNFTREQKVEIKRRLNKLVTDKLPNVKTGVNHNGYLIASQASILDFSNNNPSDRLKDFELLESQVPNIQNIADRTIVYTVLAKECAIKKKKIELLNTAFDEADKILSVKEKIGLYENALKEASSSSTDIFNSRLTKIQEEITNLDENDKYPTYRKLIDLAYKHDKQLARRLISMLDTDPGRKQLVEPINDHYDQLELEKSVLEDYSKIGQIKSRRTMANITYRMLGEINSNKRKSRNLDQTISLLYTSSKLPFFHSVPLIQFFIQNYIHNNPISDNHLTAFYEAAYSNSKLCYNLICNISNKNHSAMPSLSMDSENTFVARFGMRDQAMDFIERNVRSAETNNIVVIDPYFTAADTAFIKSLCQWSNEPSITVLTSCEAEKEFSKFAFRNNWNEISGDEFPQSFFVSASNNEKKSPFHDRWILFLDKQLGLRIGTSINAIGGKKISEISTIGHSEVERINEMVVIPLINQRVRDYNNQLIKYETFEF